LDKRKALNNFIIVGTQRTGSSAIVGALGTHPEICCGFEWTQKISTLNKIKVMSQALQGDFTTLNQAHRKHMQSIFSEDIRCIGFKRLFRSSNKWILHPKYSPALWVDRFNAHLRWFADQPSLSIIHIVRCDSLAWLCSKLMSRKTKLFSGKEYPEEIQVQADVKEAVKRLKAKKWLDSQLASLAENNPYIQILYEDFARDHRSVIERIVTFLACDPSILPESIIKLKKQSVKPVEQSIVNYDELVTVLREQNLLR